MRPISFWSGPSRLPRLPLVAALVSMSSLGLASCRCERPKPGPTLAAASASPGAATPAKDVTFTASDGAELRGKLHQAGDPRAPLVVLVHRFRGEALEWAVFAEALARAPRRYSVMNFDLRGHGLSRGGSGARADFRELSRGEVPLLVRDVRAAIEHGLTATGGKASGVVLVGSSLGATLAVQAAREEPKVSALALISPGAAIHGFSIYERFASVRELPTFIATGAEDSVSAEPATTLSRVATRAELKRYPTPGHGAIGLVVAGQPLWADLEKWLMAVYESTPQPRVPAAPDIPSAAPAPSNRKLR